MSPDKITVFNALKEQFVIEQRIKEEDEKEEEEKAIAAEEKRRKMLASMSKANRLALENMDPDAPIDQLPDCPTKWKKILEKG